MTNRSRSLGSGRRYTDDQILAAVREVNEGNDKRSVASKHGISAITLRKRSRAMGVEMREGPSVRFLKSRLMLPSDPVEIGYLAGIIDGEGCIHRNGNGWNVDVANNNLALHAWLLSIGGSITDRGGKCLHWRVLSSADVLDLLELVEPYLMVKREQAQRAIAESREKVGGGQ